MNKPKFISVIALLVACFLIVPTSFGQTENPREIEPNYEIVLQTLKSTNSSNSKSLLSADLARTMGKLKGTFSYPDYKVVSTHFGRTENGGNFTYKGIINSLDNQNNKSPVFNEWSLNGLTKEGSSSNMVSFQSFRFGARVPIVTTSLNEAKSPVINYEFIGITIQKFKVPENEPTIIGTLTLTDDNQTAFIVLTIKPVR